MKQNADEADREVHEFRCMLTSCKHSRGQSSRKTPLTPHACTKYIERAERAVSYLTEIRNKRKPFRTTHQLQLLCDRLYVFCREDRDFFVLRAQRAVQKFDDSVCLLGLWRAGAHAPDSLLCTWLIAPRCGVFAEGA